MQIKAMTHSRLMWMKLCWKLKRAQTRLNYLISIMPRDIIIHSFCLSENGDFFHKRWFSLSHSHTRSRLSLRKIAFRKRIRSREHWIEWFKPSVFRSFEWHKATQQAKFNWTVFCVFALHLNFVIVHVTFWYYQIGTFNWLYSLVFRTFYSD